MNQSDLFSFHFSIFSFCVFVLCLADYEMRLKKNLIKKDKFVGIVIDFEMLI